MTQGGKVGQLSLAFGANDMGSVMIEENVVRAAGAGYCMDEVEIVRNIEDAGFIAKRRNMHYEILGDPIFRERDVPRMLALATARADGDASVPAELVNYPARSRRRQKHAPPHQCMIAFTAPTWVLPIDRAADPRRLSRRRVDRRGRIVVTSASRDRREPRRRRARSGRVAVLPGAGQRAHASRAVVAARPRSAGAEFHSTG